MDVHPAANQELDLLVAAGPERFAAFARWVCSVLFDDSDWWAGQWGGGLSLRDGRWERPVEPALTVHPIAVRALLPYLISGLSAGDGRHLRWVYQFAVGQAYRLPPRERQQLRAAIEARCGIGEPPVALLRHAGNDALARRLLNDAATD
jgi:hypothetical protein